MAYNGNLQVAILDVGFATIKGSVYPPQKSYTEGGGGMDIDERYRNVQKKSCEEKYGTMEDAKKALGISSLYEYRLNDDFERFKCSFGAPDAPTSQTFMLKSLVEVRVTEDMMTTWVRELFDKVKLVIDKILADPIKIISLRGGSLRNPTLKKLVKEYLGSKDPALQIHDQSDDAAANARDMLRIPMGSRIVYT